MDIDTQDDLLVEYDDGDDAMPDADAEGDAEMADEEQGEPRCVRVRTALIPW